MNERNENTDIIFSYTRAQALEDGVLVDLSDWARETGIRLPVACTATVWHGHILPPEGTRELGQSERGRGHDVLWMLFNAIRRHRGGSEIRFEVFFVESVSRVDRPRRTSLKAVCGPGDGGEAVLTIMLPHED